MFLLCAKKVGATASEGFLVANKTEAFSSISQPCFTAVTKQRQRYIGLLNAGNPLINTPL